MRKKGTDFKDADRCHALNKHGERCHAPHLKGSGSLYCYWHDNKERARSASSRGGVSKANKPFEVHTNIRDIYDLATFLEEATARVAEALKVMGGK